MRLQLPSPAMVVAVAALLVALTGTAIAAQVVPLAKRAKVADNAKKLRGKTPVEVAQLPGPATTLEGKTAAEIAATPGPASAVASLVVYKTATRTLTPAEVVDVTTPCEQGQKAVGGGFQGPDNTFITSLDTRPSADGGAWRLRIASFEPDNVNVTLVTVCLK
jgi:hypothetical protein